MRVQIDGDRCQGNGRCYTLAPQLFVADDLGDGHVREDGIVTPDMEKQAWRAASSCPEHAVTLEESL